MNEILGRTAVSDVVDNRDGVCYNLVVLLPAGLSVKGEGYLLAAGLPDDDLLGSTVLVASANLATLKHLFSTLSSHLTSGPQRW